MGHVTLIEKEQLPQIQFIKSDVLTEKPMQARRQENLMRALMLGNNYRCKVKITFKTDTGFIKQVETTIWSITDKYLLLKGNLFIPIRAMVDLE